ncbi:hypothetical protein [Flavobacterium subsaxonicum]|nr:hypothetical protein [Flavobacterium subsaxonicum]
MRSLFFSCALMLCVQAFAHQKVVFEKKYGNVKLTTMLGDYGEKMNKTIIIAKYAALLSERYKYSDDINLIFVEDYNKNDSLSGSYHKASLKDSVYANAIYLYYHEFKFDIIGCLNTIEYCITLNYRQKHKIYPPKKLSQIYNSTPSKIVLEIVGNKMYRPNDVKALDKDAAYNYYYQNNTFTFFTLDENGNENKVLDLDYDMLSYEILNSKILVIMLRPDALLILNSQKDKSFRVFKIENADEYYVPLKLTLTTPDAISFRFNHFLSKNKERSMLYLIDEKIFIQDADKVVKN